MCGIVCFLGHGRGPVKVLEALHLLEYRAPDSSGMAMLAGSAGELRVRRCTGSPSRLVSTLATHPLVPVTPGAPDQVSQLLSRQALDLNPAGLRDCSRAAGWTLDDLYRPAGLSIGIGDRGALSVSAPAGPASDDRGRFSAALRRALQAADPSGRGLPDFDADPVRHAFRLLGAHVGSRAAWDEACRAELDRTLLRQVPGGAYAGWYAAWCEEMALNVPGYAFAAATHYFQRTFPSLAEHVGPGEWGRVGGITAAAMAQVVVGHGRWAMVGAVTHDNAHPLLDRSQSRAVVENGSHHAPLMLRLREEQAAWWHAHGVPCDEAVHRSDNTTEVVVYEWERAWHQLFAGELSSTEEVLRRGLEARGVGDTEEQALRIALRRMTVGNAHACAFYSRRRPGVLYVSSHHKPVAVAICRRHTGGGQQTEIMVASDINAALMMWPGSAVDAAALRQAQDFALRHAQEFALRHAQEFALRHAQAIAHGPNDTSPERFAVDVVFLDANLDGGNELFARIEQRVEDGHVVPRIQVTHYDGESLAVAPAPLRLNPAMVGRGAHATYTEHHISEIPAVLDGLIESYTWDGCVNLVTELSDGELWDLGLNRVALSERFGPQLADLRRLWLVGEGSSWRDALAAAPLFRALLPAHVSVMRPVELLNLGGAVDPVGDLAVEISWSGTTDALLKVDSWLDDMGLLRLGITGRPQSDLARRTTRSAGVLDVRTGVEISVATVKGYHAILTTLDLLALQLAVLRGDVGVGSVADMVRELTDELTQNIPRHVAAIVGDVQRRRRIRAVARHFGQFNKVAVVGGSPVDTEAELKIEELAQIVAVALPFGGLRPLIERTAAACHDRERTLFVVSATAPRYHGPAGTLLACLEDLGVSSIVHTTPHPQLAAWQTLASAEVFVSPQTAEPLQPLLDVLFFFDLAVALAYARGLSPSDIDRPRNLAKSVTTTGAERRQNVEARREFQALSLEEFGTQNTAPDGDRRPSAVGLFAALKRVVGEAESSPPRGLTTSGRSRIEVEVDSEVAGDVVTASAAAWWELLGIELRPVDVSEASVGGSSTLRLLQAGSATSPAMIDPRTIILPTEHRAAELELVATTYLITLALRLARAQGSDITAWDAAVGRLPAYIGNLRADPVLRRALREILGPYVAAGYDKLQVIGGGQDYAGACSMARTIRSVGFMAEALYTDSAWHGPLATVGGPDAEHDTLILILAADALFQAAALVDTQVYRARHAAVILVVPDRDQDLPSVRGVHPSAVLPVPSVPRAFLPLAHAVVGQVLAEALAGLWRGRV